MAGGCCAFVDLYLLPVQADQWRDLGVLLIDRGNNTMLH